MDNNEGEKEEEDDTAPACYPKMAEVGVNLNGYSFGDVNKQYTLVFGDANELAVFLVMLMDSLYVVMHMNWPCLVTGESQ